jgi:hypothetical protein
MEATLHSVLRQTDPDIHMVVVANTPPECRLPDDPRLEVALVDFDRSESTPGKPSLVGIEKDKGAKLAAGTSILTRLGATHTMFVDSDDYIHRDIAAYAAEHPEHPGWYFDSGYFHIRGERKVTTVTHEYHQRNGTSHVMRTDLLDVPPDLDLTLDREEMLDASGRAKVTQIMGRHRPVVEYFRTIGHPLEPYPYPAAIWEIGTGENCTGVVAASGAKQPIEGRISEEFGLPVPSRATAARAVTSVFVTRVGRHLRRAS